MVATDPRFAESGYAHPEVLVSTDWVAEHLDDPNVRIVESDEDVLLYDMGHIRVPSTSTGTLICRTRSNAIFSTRRASRRYWARTASATTRQSCSTATATTGMPPTPTGCSSISDIATRGDERRSRQVGS